MNKIILCIIAVVLCSCSTNWAIVGYMQNGYILDKEKNTVANYSNGYIRDKSGNVVGSYRNGYILDSSDSIIATYTNGYILNQSTHNAIN